MKNTKQNGLSNNMGQLCHGFDTHLQNTMSMFMFGYLSIVSGS